MVGLEEKQSCLCLVHIENKCLWFIFQFWVENMRGADEIILKLDFKKLKCIQVWQYDMEMNFRSHYRIW